MQGILPVALLVILQNKKDKLHDRYLSGVAKHVHIFVIIALYEIFQIFSASNTCVLVCFGFLFWIFKLCIYFLKLPLPNVELFLQVSNSSLWLGMVCETRYTNLPFWLWKIFQMLIYKCTMFFEDVSFSTWTVNSSVVFFNICMWQYSEPVTG